MTTTRPGCPSCPVTRAAGYAYCGVCGARVGGSWVRTRRVVLRRPGR